MNLRQCRLDGQEYQCAKSTEVATDDHADTFIPRWKGSQGGGGEWRGWDAASPYTAQRIKGFRICKHNVVRHRNCLVWKTLQTIIERAPGGVVPENVCSTPGYAGNQCPRAPELCKGLIQLHSFRRTGRALPNSKFEVHVALGRTSCAQPQGLRRVCALGDAAAFYCVAEGLGQHSNFLKVRRGMDMHRQRQADACGGHAPAHLRPRCPRRKHNAQDLAERSRRCRLHAAAGHDSPLAVLLQRTDCSLNSHRCRPRQKLAAGTQTRNISICKTCLHATQW